MYKLCVAVFFLMIAQQAIADDLRFETTTEGIANALINSKNAANIKTRGIKAFSDTKTRGIMIVTEEQGEIVKKKIMVSEDQSEQGVNLKIEFDIDSHSIRPESYQLLNELGKALIDEKLMGIPMIIKGHTDSDGDAAYNLKLSFQRGISVKQYLTSNFAISPSSLIVVGYGEVMALVPNNSIANKQINRRVEINTMPRKRF